MPSLKIYDIFISHSWDYNEGYYSMADKIKSYPNLVTRNYSVPQHDSLNTKTDKELYEALCRQIKPVNVVLVLAGMYVNNRKWIQKEIEIAKLYNKPIIAIKPWNAQKMPLELELSADVVVNWNVDSVVDAIRKYSI
jgi:hypothetical protein